MHRSLNPDTLSESTDGAYVLRDSGKTENHPLQRNIFSPPLVSSMSEVGVIARAIIAIFATLVIAYLTLSNTLPDESPTKAKYYFYAAVLTGLDFVFAIIEYMRSVRMLDTDRFGRKPRYAILAVNFVAVVCLFLGVGNLVYLHSHAYEQRVEEAGRRRAKEAEQERQRQEAERLRKDAEAECVVQRTKEAEPLPKRSSSAWRDYNTCKNEYLKPIFSEVTAEQHCSGKRREALAIDKNLKDVQARDCTQLTK